MRRISCRHSFFFFFCLGDLGQPGLGRGGGTGWQRKGGAGSGRAVVWMRVLAGHTEECITGGRELSELSGGGRTKPETYLPGTTPRPTPPDRPDGETGSSPREMLQGHWTRPTTATSTNTGCIPDPRPCSHCSLHTAPPSLPLPNYTSRSRPVQHNKFQGRLFSLGIYHNGGAEGTVWTPVAKEAE